MQRNRPLPRLTKAQSWHTQSELVTFVAQPLPASPDRSIAAAQAFFRKALSMSLPRWPRKITLDGHKQSHLALRLLRREDPKWKYVQVRSSQYLNNLIEQDHRAIKRRCASMGGFRSFGSAAITLAGIELAHRIRKRQFSFGRGQYQNSGSLTQLWDRALA
jgi:transposase-like protein